MKLDNKNKAFDNKNKAFDNKNKPKRPYFIRDSYYDREPVLDAWQCPVCGEEYEIEIRHNYCPNCGQAIDWTYYPEEEKA